MKIILLFLCYRHHVEYHTYMPMVSQFRNFSKLCRIYCGPTLPRSGHIQNILDLIRLLTH